MMYLEKGKFRDNILVVGIEGSRTECNCLMGVEFLFSKVKSSGDSLHNSGNVTHITELYTEKCLRL